MTELEIAERKLLESVHENLIEELEFVLDGIDLSPYCKFKEFAKAAREVFRLRSA